jgi:uncharacterized protein YwqG
MNLDGAVAVIRASGLVDRLDRILPHLAPSLRIRTVRDGGAANELVSRFAGYPVLPRGEPWPEWDSSALHRRWVAYSIESAQQPGVSQRFWHQQIDKYEELVRDNPRPLRFLAMIRMEEIAPHASMLRLPKEGTLLFFYDAERMQGSFWPEARGGWRILNVQDDGDLSTVRQPPVPADEFAPCRLAFELQYSLPEDIRAETGDADLRVYGSPEYKNLHQALLGGSSGDNVIHQLGGAPQEVQHGLFHECQLASNGVDCGKPEDFQKPQARLLAPGAKDWQLVLQIDSDEPGPGWMWGDLGRLYYCLHKDDLAARRFDRSWCVEQCS